MNILILNNKETYYYSRYFCYKVNTTSENKSFIYDSYDFNGKKVSIWKNGYGYLTILGRSYEEYLKDAKVGVEWCREFLYESDENSDHVII